MVRINNLSYRIDGRLLLEGASADLADGQKVGLVGRNGAGKSTLLRLLCGDIEPESGTIETSAHARTTLVAQELPTGTASLISTVLAADTERTHLLAEAETETDPARIADIHERLNAIDAHGAPARAATILAGLGFSQDDQQRELDALSGGWRMRVALAASLFARPEILLLDEPTNHLDLESTLWFEAHLATYPHTLVLVSHDRNLLNTVPRQILHLDRGKLTAYRGNYDQFDQERRRRRHFAAKALEKQLAQRRHMEAYVERFRFKASKARQAQSKLKALARMAPPEPVIAEHGVLFDFPEPEPLAPPLITLEGVAAGYDGQIVLDRLDLRIDMDDRIALLGANGNGKSTLAKILSKRLEIAAGTMTAHRKLRVGYFAQHQLEELDPAATPYAQMARLMGQAPERAVRAQLGRFDFAKSQADTATKDLSGGEKARLLLALISHSAPHILILDEPTNHLDIDRREALVQALNAFSGAVILITHDPHLVELVADRLWLVKDGSCRPFDGDMDDYRRAARDEARLAASAARGRPKIAGPPQEAPPGARHMAGRRGRRADRAARIKAAAKAEKRLAELVAARDKIETALADPALYDAAEKADTMPRNIELNRLHDRLSTEIAAAEEAWLAAQERLEETG